MIATIEPANGAAPLLQRTLTWTSKSRAGNARWWYVASASLLQFLGIALVIPILPRLKSQFFGGDLVTAARAQAASETARAILTALVSSELGKLSDMVGRRPIMLLAVLCALAPIACLTVFSNLWFYFIIFGLVGALGGESSFVFNAYIADCSPECDRARRFGMVGAMTAVVFALAPIVGTQLESRTSTWTVFCVCVCVEVLGCVCVFLLPESLPEERRVTHNVKMSSESIVQPLREFIRKANTRMHHLIAVRIFRGCIMGGRQTVILFALAELIPYWTDQDNGILFIVIGFGMIISQGLFLPCLLRLSFKEIPLLLASQLASTCQDGIVLLLLGLYPSKTLLFCILLLGSCFSWFDPVFTKLVAAGQEGDLGLVLGVFQSVDALVACIAPILFTTLFAAGGIWPFALIFLFDTLALIMVIVLARPVG